MDESVDRLRRLYDQLVPFGIRCNVSDTHEHIYKLRPRSAPAVVTGTGPSTTHYRVCLLNDPKFSVHIVRHINTPAPQYEQVKLQGYVHNMAQSAKHRQQQTRSKQTTKRPARKTLAAC
jgi:hypothetical protein